MSELYQPQFRMQVAAQAALPPGIEAVMSEAQASGGLLVVSGRPMNVLAPRSMGGWEHHYDSDQPTSYIEELTIVPSHLGVHGEPAQHFRHLSPEFRGPFPYLWGEDVGSGVQYRFGVSDALKFQCRVVPVPETTPLDIVGQIEV